MECKAYEADMGFNENYKSLSNEKDNSELTCNDDVMQASINVTQPISRFF